MSHLDSQSMKRLLAGDAATVAQFREHLGTGCEECLRFLETDSSTPELDGEVDRLLLGLAPAAEASLDEVGFQRMMRRAKAPRWRVPLASAAAVAAALLVGVFSLRAGPVGDGGEAGLKGGARIALDLSAAVQTASGELQRAELGQPLPDSSTLLLRYHATERGQALLLKATGEKLEPLGTFALNPGTHDLSAPGGGVAGLSLQGESGRVQLYLVASPGESAPGLDAARQAIASPGHAGLGVSALSFTVKAAQP